MMILDKKTGATSFTFAEKPPDGFFEVDEDGRPVFPNPSTVEMEFEKDSFSFKD